MKTWTEEEILLLKNKYLTSTNEQLKTLFPNKTDLAVYKKAYKLGFRKSNDIVFQNKSNARKREKSTFWKGGKRKTAKGYIQVLCPEHHRADQSGYVMEHILVFENATGLIIPDNCVVHHINGNKKDNRIENLCVMERGAHTTLHFTGRKMSEKTKKRISESRRKRS